MAKKGKTVLEALDDGDAVAPLKQRGRKTVLEALDDGDTVKALKQPEPEESISVPLGTDDRNKYRKNK